MPCPAFFSGKETSYSISSTAGPQHFGRLHQESSLRSVRRVTLCEKEGGSDRDGESPRVSGIQWWCLPEDGSKDGPPPDAYFSFYHHRAQAFNTDWAFPACGGESYTFLRLSPEQFLQRSQGVGVRGVTYKGDGGLLSFPFRIGKTSETTEGFPRAGMSWESLTAWAGGLAASAGEHPGSHVSLLKHSKPYPMVWWLGMVSFWDVVVEVG